MADPEPESTRRRLAIATRPAGPVQPAVPGGDSKAAAPPSWPWHGRRQPLDPTRVVDAVVDASNAVRIELRTLRESAAVHARERVGRLQRRNTINGPALPRARNAVPLIAQLQLQHGESRRSHHELAGGGGRSASASEEDASPPPRPHARAPPPAPRPRHPGAPSAPLPAQSSGTDINQRGAARQAR
eukprot:tig00001206_g7516.t1